MLTRTSSILILTLTLSLSILPQTTFKTKMGNIIKNAYSATNKFNDHFCSIHKVLRDPTESPSNILFSRLESMTQRKLNNQHFSIPYITCDFVYSRYI